MPATTLTKTEDTKPTISKTELADLERRVREGLQSFLDVGKALSEIRETNAWKLRAGHKTFEDYCLAEFKFSLRHGQRMIAAAETATAVKKATGQTLSNEAVARAIAPAASDPKLLQKVQSKLEATGQSIKTATAEAVAKVVDSVMPKTISMFGNGHAPEPPKPDVHITTSNDACPHCHQVPTHYGKLDDGQWRCGACGEKVLLGVSAAVVDACKDCGATLLPGAEYCTTCGSVQEPT